MTGTRDGARGPLTVLSMGTTQDWTPLACYDVCCKFTRQYFQVVVYTVCTTCMCGQVRTIVQLIAPHSSRNLMSTFGPEL
jgi:hypothetical protein